MNKSHMRNNFPTARWFTIGLSLVMIAAGSFCLTNATASSTAPGSNGDIDLARHLEGAFESVADKTSPSVVVITTKHKSGEATGSQDGDDENNGQQFNGTP